MMSMNIVDALTGRVVSKIIKVHDYHQIYFIDGSILSISARSNIDHVSAVINDDKPKISTIIFTEFSLFIYFSNEYCIDIEIEESNGPEAVNFIDGINNIYITI
jgi:hypothetical protein